MRSNRKGFTLIELLIVVVIIGILAAIAIPKFANTKEKAYVAAMKSDLKNLATSQEAYFSDYQTYTTTLTAAQFNASTSVNVSVTSASGTSWAAPRDAQQHDEDLHDHVRHDGHDGRHPDLPVVPVLVC